MGILRMSTSCRASSGELACKGQTVSYSGEGKIGGKLAALLRDCDREDTAAFLSAVAAAVASIVQKAGAR